MKMIKRDTVLVNSVLCVAEKVIEKMAAGDNPYFEVIREQYRASKKAVEKIDSAGFWVKFSDFGSSQPLSVQDGMHIDDVKGIDLNGHTIAFFWLWFSNGYISLLEGTFYENRDSYENDLNNMLFIYSPCIYENGLRNRDLDYVRMRLSINTC